MARAPRMSMAKPPTGAMPAAPAWTGVVGAVALALAVGVAAAWLVVAATAEEAAAEEAAAEEAAAEEAAAEVAAAADDAAAGAELAAAPPPAAASAQSLSEAGRTWFRAVSTPQAAITQLVAADEMAALLAGSQVQA